MKVTPEYVVIGAIIAYVAFFTRPPPRFVQSVLASPVGQVIVLVGVVFAFMKNQPIGLLLGVAYLSSVYPVLEYLDAAEQKPEPPKEKEQPKSGAPKPDLADIGKLASLLGKSGTMPQERGKDVKSPPPPTATVKPHSDPKVTEKFSMF